MTRPHAIQAAWFRVDRGRRRETEDVLSIGQLDRPRDPSASFEPANDDAEDRACGPVEACHGGDVDAVVAVGPVGGGAVPVYREREERGNGAGRSHGAVRHQGRRLRLPANAILTRLSMSGSAGVQPGLGSWRPGSRRGRSWDAWVRRAASAVR